MYNPKLPMTDIPLKASLRHRRSKDCVTLRHISLLFSAQSALIWWHLTIGGHRRKWSNFNSFWSPKCLRGINHSLLKYMVDRSKFFISDLELKVHPYPPFPFSGQCTAQPIMSTFEIFICSTSGWRTSCLVDGLSFCPSSACLTKTLWSSNLRGKL